MKILQKVKNLENDKFLKMKDRINKKHFNSSVYNVQSNVNIPLLFSQNKRSKKNINKNNQNNKYSKIDINEDSILELKDHKENKSQGTGNNNKTKGTLTKRASYYCFMKLGRTYTFFGDKYGSPLIVIGPHWPMYLFCCSLVTFIFYIFFKHFWKYMNIMFKIMGMTVYLVYFLSYTYTFLINPGIPKYDEDAILGKPREKYRFCKKCGIWTNVEDNTAHCFDCDICYEGYDHHCPWTGKCIAKKNANSFYVFIASILCCFCYFVTALTHAQHTVFLLNKKNKKLLI
jgi:hypothetical protein